MNAPIINRLFPTAVLDFTLDEAVSQEEYDYILSAETRGNAGNRTSCNSYILEEVVMKRLRSKCLECVNKYIQLVCKPSSNVEGYLTQSWANLAYGTEFHHRHQHQNSFISGVLFVETNEQDKIEFYSRNPEDQLRIPTDKFDDLNSRTWWYPAVKNHVIVFPSNLKHSVPEAGTDRDKDRVSIAFNSFLRGTLGDAFELTELKL